MKLIDPRRYQSQYKMKLRISYTLLNMWQSDWQRATEYYFKLKTFTSPAMAAGKDYHAKIAQEITQNKRLPDIFGGAELNNPLVETKIVTKLATWADLVGVIDLMADDTVYDFKTGKTPSGDYASGYQMGIYGLLAKSQGYKPTRGIFLHHDTHRGTTDQSIVYLDREYLSKTLDWIETLGSEIHNYFDSNGLYKRFGREGEI